MSNYARVRAMLNIDGSPNGPTQPSDLMTPRIASLLPSATETIAALGAAQALVARSHECDEPAAIAHLPAVTAPKLNPHAAGAAIHAEVGALLAHALSIFEVDAARLRTLRPDVIVTQTQCEVCAVSLDDVTRALADWVGAAPRLVALQPMSLADIFADIARVAAAIGRVGHGARLIADRRDRLARIAATAEALPRPRVATLEWLDPPMAGGNWMPELVAMAGGDNLFGDAGQHSPWLAWEALRDADPDVILVLPCGFTLPRALSEMPGLASRPGWPALKAVRTGQVYVLDGHRHFNRPGPRLHESLEILAEILHPAHFHFGHEGRSWHRWTATLTAQAARI
jgi:iron complex transport system substrate-binding protein